MSNRPSRTLVVAIAGPTAIGKTAVGLALVKLLSGNAHILSVDSMQVYCGMDIGTAKPTRSEQSNAKFHLIDIVDPQERFTVSDFQRLARASLDEVFAQSCSALLVGGTGLYLRAVLSHGLGIPETPPDEDLRRAWQAYAKRNGQKALQDALAAVDPAAASRLHGNDTRRIIRALEVYQKTGMCLSYWHEKDRQRLAGQLDDRSNANTFFFALDRNREALYSDINQRVESMIQSGWIEEVQTLRKSGLSAQARPMQSLGYKQINQFLDGLIDLDDALVEIKAQTRHFARRQLIWLRSQPNVRWINVDDKSPGQVAHDIALVLDSRYKAGKTIT